MFVWSTDPLPPARHNNFTGWKPFWVAITLIKSLCYAIRFHARRNGYVLQWIWLKALDLSPLYFHLFSAPLLSLGANFRLWVALSNHSSGSEFWKAKRQCFPRTYIAYIVLILTLIQILLDNSESKPWAAQPTAERTRRGGVKAIGEP